MITFGAPAGLALLGFIPLVIALYFMRARPRRHVVPSNRLWAEVLRRRREESILGRFRNSIFLLLHLLLVVLGALALADPRRPGGLEGDTLFIVDTSASMAATDEAGGRLRAAKEKIRVRLAQLDPASKVALVEAGTSVRPLARPSTERAPFLAALAGLETTEGAGPDPAELASFLQTLPAGAYARSYFFTDNCPAAGLADIPAIGRLAVESVGSGAENLGITGFDVTAGTEGRDVAVQVRNFGPLPSRCRVALEDDAGTAIGSEEATLAAGTDRVVLFAKVKTAATALVARVAPTGSPDRLACDDVAYALLGRRSRRALVIDRPGSALAQVAASPRLGLTVTLHDRNRAGAGLPDLATFDVILANGVWRPEFEARNVLAFLPFEGTGEILEQPRASFIETTHPVMRYLSWEDVGVRRARGLTHRGRALVSAGDRDLIVAEEGGGTRRVRAGFTLEETDLAYRIAFPILVANAVAWIAGGDGMAANGSRVGDTVQIASGAERAEVKSGGTARTVAGRLAGDSLALDPFRTVGLVEVKTDRATALFAVNLLSLAESNIRPEAAVDSGAGPDLPEPSGRRPVWREVLWLFLALLLAEWFLWHRLGG